MELPLIFQGGQFLLSLALGTFYGLCYDLIKGLRLSIPWLTHLLDFIFGLFCLFGNLLFALYAGDGEYRIFMFLGTCLGAGLYFLVLSRLFLPLSRLLWRFLTLPLRKLLQFFGFLLRKCGKFLKNIFSSWKKSYIIKKYHKKTYQGDLEEKNSATVQIKLCYQTDPVVAADLRHHDHRRSAVQD
ncbi:MAG: spore cortex biosynthesis protein YabQ [Oscillospiraceae bacterium]|nr:spore cortex biosynthesis protein YabQ [Oscillospiraceae bacterium]